MKNIFKLFVLLFLLIHFYSCNKNKKEYYENGRLKSIYHTSNGKLEGFFISYYSNGKFKENHYYLHGEKIDSSMYYYGNALNSLKQKIKYYNNSDTTFIENYFENGVLESVGKQINNKIKIGFWNSYNSDKSLKSKIEYINLNGKEIANRLYFYNKDRSINIENSNFFEIKTYDSDTIKVGEAFRIDLFLFPYFSDKSDVFITIPKNLNNFIDISNLESMELDTIWNISKDKRIHKSTLTKQDLENSNLKVYLLLAFKNEGIKYIQGIINEPSPQNLDSLGTGMIKKYYFEKKILVVK